MAGEPAPRFPGARIKLAVEAVESRAVILVNKMRRLVRHDGAGPKVVDVRISQLRRLLRQRCAPDPAIGVIWAYGYFLIADAYEWIQLQLRGAHGTSA